MMKLDRARPLAAFFLVTLACAAVLAEGMRAPGLTGIVAGPADRGSESATLSATVLGSVLVARPLVVTPSTSPAAVPVAAAVPAVPSVQATASEAVAFVQARPAPTQAPAATAGSGGAHRPAVSRPTTTSRTDPATTGHGRHAARAHAKARAAHRAHAKHRGH